MQEYIMEVYDPTQYLAGLGGSKSSPYRYSYLSIIMCMSWPV
jgi:hypothetical protein